MTATPGTEPLTTAAVRAERDGVAAALAGDGQAFRALVEPHLTVLYRMAARACGDPQLAEDAVQETLTLAFRRLHTYEPRTSFRAFLAGIAVKRAHTLARAERRRQRREQAARPPEVPATPEQMVSAAMLARHIRRLLAAMPKQRRAAALLRFDAGLSHREIAHCLGTSEGSARVLVHTATKQLREQLAELIELDPKPKENDHERR